MLNLSDFQCIAALFCDTWHHLHFHLRFCLQIVEGVADLNEAREDIFAFLSCLASCSQATAICTV